MNNIQIAKILKTEKDKKLIAGEFYEVKPYFLDPEKLVLVRRLYTSKPYYPEYTIYRNMVELHHMEMETCECGHSAPTGFVIYDKNGCGTCMPCHIEYLNEMIKKLRKKNRNKQS